MRPYSSVFFVSGLLALLTGCATSVTNYSPKTVEISEPPLGAISTAYIGDSMVRQGKYVEHESIFVPSDISAGVYTITRGTYLKRGERDGVEYFRPGGEGAGDVQKPALADPWDSVIVKNRNQPEICVLTAYGTSVTTCSSGGGLFERRMVPAIASDGFQQTLIYSGKVGTKINVGYREFSNHIARPAFNNDVEYDLSDSNVIGYKGAQLEVLDANNQMIKYRVIKNFNAAQR